MKYVLGLILIAQSLQAVPHTVCGIPVVADNAQNAGLGYDDCRMHLNGELRVTQQCIAENSIVFDIGANCGDWTQCVLQHHKPRIIFAFEPTPQTFQRLAHRFQNMQCVTCVKKAMSDAQGTTQFMQYAKNEETQCLNSFFHRPIVAQNNAIQPTPITVQTISVDAFCAQENIDHIDFLKIDTEGAELLVLKGAQDMLKKGAINMLQFEYGGTFQDAHTTLKEVYDLLIHCGYHMFRITHNALIYLDHWHEGLETYRYSNYLAIKAH